MTKVRDHLHKLRKKKSKTGKGMMFCTLPDCYFKIETEYTIGKEVICNICDEPFIMNEASIKLDKPHCSECGRRAVTDPATGKKHYVHVRKSRQLGVVTQASTADLKERLANIVNYTPDGDI